MVTSGVVSTEGISACLPVLDPAAGLNYHQRPHRPSFASLLQTIQTDAASGPIHCHTSCRLLRNICRSPSIGARDWPDERGTLVGHARLTPIREQWQDGHL